MPVGRRKQQLWLIEPDTPLHSFTFARARQLLDEHMTAAEEPALLRMGLSAELDSFQLVLEDELAPLPPGDGKGLLASVAVSAAPSAGQAQRAGGRAAVGGTGEHRTLQSGDRHGRSARALRMSLRRGAGVATLVQLVYEAQLR